MRKECERTRKSLHKYLRGHLFKPEQKRIERHLKECVLCRSELEALKRSAETKKLLKDITPPEGVVQRVKAGVSGLSRVKKILYRPLWLLGIAALAAGIYYYVIVPGRIPWLNAADEGADAPKPAASSAPLSTPTMTTAPTTALTPSPAAAVPQRPEQAAVVPAEKSMDPLVVVITTDDERTARRRVNEVMRGHGALRKMQLSDTVKEISGRMTAKELLTFFARIGSAGKVQYSRSRFESFPSAESIPFILRVKESPSGGERAAEKRAAPQPAPQAADKPLEKPVSQSTSTP